MNKVSSLKLKHRLEELSDAFTIEEHPFAVDIIIPIDDEYGIVWRFDFDGAIVYPSLSLGIKDEEDGWLFHTLCEVNESISYRLARSLSVTPFIANSIYKEAQDYLSVAESYIAGFESSLSHPLSIENGKINPEILSGIVRFGIKDYRDWSEAVQSKGSHLLKVK